MDNFLINQRYRVQPSLHILYDLQLQSETRLEPRLMQLLCLMAQQPDQLLSRETLIQEIWDNYPGADEGLTNAVSFLRKILGDDQKEMIRTVPKKGYLLKAHITSATEKNGSPSRKRIYGYAAVAALTIIVLTAAFMTRQTTITPPTIKNVSTEVAFPDLSNDSSDHYLTTVTTTDTAGVKYRLVMIGDRRPVFYVNDSVSNQEPYTELIDQMARELWKRQAAAEIGQ
ncbi:winged helix-turn-helix domain-containing protein [Chitinophaga arvensicola]|uniref:DNA-binding winged helix-turn-helix (WHTH) domain-containing protein n=1 Tax=Chitinophaga arvensicola TaxID=29529 RepID=A0A1I0S9X6_9BACT|nr:helix-turn-helix domain-containing protein [Chitinophaga arvensicola]SEW53019.1 DNA-binding winged helix-turn-helix (wHTH) domain-containing protein [Chitinophaga arvensicola]